MARKGLPKSIIKKYGITKKAWRVFRGRSKSSASRRRTTRRKNKPIRRRYNLARRRRGRRGNNIQGTVFKWLRVGSLIAPGAYEFARAPGRNPGDIVADVFSVYSGYSIKDGGIDIDTGEGKGSPLGHPVHRKKKKKG